MNKKFIKIVIPSFVGVLMLCGVAYIVYALTNQKESEDSTVAAVTMEQPIVEVDTVILRKQTFQKQILCNGKLVAIRRAELMCPKAGELLKRVNVKNGQHVSAGTVLAIADTRDMNTALEKAKHDLEKAKVDLQDKLIGLGYDADAKNVPADVLKKAEMTSGYYSAKYALKAAETSLADCRLLAPFSGKVANLVARPYQRGDKFCTLIDDSYFDVEFKILESELASVMIGTAVKVSPFIDEGIILNGTVAEINPTIDEKGLVNIKARVKNNSDRLLDGMNVRVIIENSVPDMFVVPKEAVVERDGYHVVFVYDKETHRAIWTYVDILYSNLSSFAITGSEKKQTTVNAGDIVITSGNLNLADDTEVMISSIDN
ncbi:MAG: efflux RND transporter periplasmic adaptor subunit [Prevotella sp.]|nr:efflux RND transporter periplasmic adaptor subunit [Prevotella sp.]